MFIVRGYGSGPRYATAIRTTSYSIPSTAWNDVPGMYAEGLPGDPPPEMVDGKLKVPGSGLYTVTALSSYNNTGGQIRIVRNHESVIIAIGPTSGFGSGSNTTPVQLELEADELVWLQVTKNTSLIRNLTSCSLELSPVAA